jgi:hypothetical protein
MRIGMGKAKYWKYLSVHHISYMNRLGIELGAALLEVGGKPPELWHDRTSAYFLSS